MSVNFVADDDLREALRPFRVGAEDFKSGIHKRLKDWGDRKDDPLAGMPAALRYASTLLPLQFLSGGKISDATLNAVSATGFGKFFGILMLPAVSLLLLVGTVVIGALKIRGIQRDNTSGSGDPMAAITTFSLWNRKYMGLQFAALLVLSFLFWTGATWCVFLFLVVSSGVLICVLRSLAKQGIGNRFFVGEVCATGLMTLGQMGFAYSHGSDIHVVDQSLIMFIFVIGSAGILSLAGVGSLVLNMAIVGLVFTPLVCVLWSNGPRFVPVTRTEIKNYVESFDRARFHTATWSRWAIPAKWAIERGLNPDLTKPSQLFSAELAGQQHPLIVGIAMDVGMMKGEQIAQWREYPRRRKSFFELLRATNASQPLLSLPFDAATIRAAVLLDDLTEEERNLLESRLKTTLRSDRVFLSNRAIRDVTFEERLLAAQLLQLIGRPAHADEFREKIHAQLRKLHVKPGKRFVEPGGFTKYEKIQWSQLEETRNAIELMEIFGIPAGLDLNWVRSYLRTTVYDATAERCIKAVLRDRLERLPGAKPRTWLEVVYYERTLLAAITLVGLCYFATYSSPILKQNSDVRATQSAVSRRG